MSNIGSILLAYSGGLDTSVALKWLQDRYNCDVYCLIVDVGQQEDFSEIAQRAKATGAKDVIIEDIREKFVHDFIFPMLQAHPSYEAQYLLGSAISRPAIAEIQLDVAKRLSVDALAHGATGKGNDQFRFELSYAALGSDLQVIAPWRMWPFRSRSDLITYARARDVPLAASTSVHKPLSMDRNIIHTSYEGELLENPASRAPSTAFDRVRDIEFTPNAPEEITVTFKNGMPTALNGKKLSPSQLLEKLNDLGARHGVGRVDHVESRFLGMKSRNVYETPGLTILYGAHRAADSMCLDKEVLFLKETLMPTYAKYIYNGLWFSPERIMLQAAYDSMSRYVTADITMSVFKGNVGVVKRHVDNSLYDVKLSSLEEDLDFVHSDSSGFIRLSSQRLRKVKKMEIELLNKNQGVTKSVRSALVTSK